ncbi:BTB/POZ domain-containing protein At5g48130 [Punica granatum]|uniref:Uncharacterized protein n=2 Tax=Punica granatum TaxID=22663 RepID=A0A218X527_PUNGR|nr:BTB/POZ domain-containing protein At5g48130 [Punica granatum]OWM79760.1 hypothetical protein CDL15_Pgr023172 [Punica granatum]PKI64219.1 hypothetical protein CRG98_015406 [Punica granatum]
MEFASPKEGSVASSPSPFPSPNIGALLKIKILSWSQETGLPATVRVHVGDRTFNFHKFPLSSKSGYFKRRLDESMEVELPLDFPGGPEIFEMIVLFVYGSSTMIDAFNVAALRCAAEFLEMTEEYSSGNLCERFDLYMNQVVLQNWDDTLIVLQKCQALLPWAEELLIVSRCIESLAFMACMEILDPERRRELPVVTLEVLGNHPWSCERAEKIVSRDLWIKDLIALPFGFFKRIIGSLRRQGMNEKYVTPIIVFYANKWVISGKTQQSPENSSEKDSAGIFDAVLDLLPMGEKASRQIPVGFYFALLTKSLEFGLRIDAKAKLYDQIASALPYARLDDFILPRTCVDPISLSRELATMEKIVSRFVVLSHEMDASRTPLMSNSMVAELWDAYLSHVAIDRELRPTRFMKLIETVPISYRHSHDNLYRAINTFLQVHLEISQEEKGAVCKYLSCQKLSQDVCIEAVQNELMPLRLIVQALFVQQLNTQQVFKECSDSFRYNHFGEFSGSLSSSRCPFSKSQNLGESPSMEEIDRRPLSFLLQKDHSSIPRPDDLPDSKDYESTSFRIQSLEQELMSLKRSLQGKNALKKTELGSGKQQSKKSNGFDERSLSKRRNTFGQMTTGCIGSMTFTSQRRYAGRLMMKIFRRLSLFGSRNSKKKTGAPGSWPRSF